MSNEVKVKNIIKFMIKDFLIISCIGKIDLLGLKLNNEFFIHKLVKDIKNNETLTTNILNFIKKNNVNIDNNFSIIVNQGPGRFSAIRKSLAIAKGIKISKGAKLYGYKETQLSEFNLENIDLLIKKKYLENKLIKPVYIS